MRFGKSWIALNWAAALYHLESVRRVIVVTTTSGVGVWEGQIEQHCSVAWAILDHHGEILSQSGGGDLRDKLQFLVVNYANLYQRIHADPDNRRSWVVGDNRTLVKFKAQACILDESHYVGNPTAITSKFLYRLVKPMKFRLFMTGTMFHRKPLSVFGQFRFYDDGKTFGTAFGHFKKRVAIWGGYGGYEIVEYQNLDWMMEKVRKVVEIVPYKPPPRPQYNKVYIHLDGKHLRAYNDMLVDKVLDVGDQKVVSEIIITQHLRLLQIAGGFVKLPDGSYRQVGDCTINMCKARLEDYLEQGIHKVVIGCMFKPEIAAVAAVAKKVGFAPVLLHGGVKAGRERQIRIQRFNKTRKPAVFIAQIATGKEAIDLSSADTLLWYSLPTSYVDYDQFQSRIVEYNEERTLQYDFLLPRGTQAEVAYDAMQLKMDVARYLVVNPQRAEEVYAAAQRAKGK